MKQRERKEAKRCRQSNSRFKFQNSFLEQDTTDDESREKKGSESSSSTKKNKQQRHKAKETPSTPNHQTKKSEERTLIENTNIVKSFVDKLGPDNYPKIQNVKEA